MYGNNNLSHVNLQIIDFVLHGNFLWFTSLAPQLKYRCTISEMVGSSRGKAVKQVSVEVLVSLSTLRITIGSRVLQRSIQWVSIWACHVTI